MTTGEALSGARGEDVFAAGELEKGETAGFNNLVKAIIVEAGDVTFTEIVLENKDGEAIPFSSNYITNAIARPTGAILTFKHPVRKIVCSGASAYVQLLWAD